MINLVIFDWKRTLYDPDKKELIYGTEKILKLLKNNKIPAILIGKGADQMHDEVARLNLKKFFHKILFVNSVKNIEIYKQYIKLKNSKNIFFVGDRVRSELEIGKRLGATTIWVKQGKFAAELPQNRFQKPDFTVNSIIECITLFETIL